MSNMLSVLHSNAYRCTPLFSSPTSKFTPIMSTEGAGIAATLKQQKEHFVSDLLGGSIEEIYYVTGISLTAYLALSVMTKSLPAFTNILSDYFLNVMTLLLAITTYSGQIDRLHWIVAGPIALAYVLNIVLGTPKSDEKSKPAPELLPKKSFITAYRSHMLILTNLAILAVDFRIFPRRFAKVETWGTSMMDLGVGSFVFSMGLVNSRSVIKQRYNSSNVGGFGIKQYFQLIWKSTVKSVPVLLLGIIRLVSVKSLEYQEHVTEYGIHWNFFMTLGFLPIFLGILDPLLNFFPRILVATAIGLGYDIVLNNTELLSYILRSDNRLDSIFSMNKEGICSFVGYLSIFLYGQSFGSFVLTGYKTPRNLIWMVSKKDLQKKPKKGSDWLLASTTKGLVIYTVLFHILLWYIQNSIYFSNISRRLANFPYVIWVVSYNATLLTGYNLVEAFTGKVDSTILNAINNNGLLIFLLANLGTGLVNMSINTLESSSVVSLVILIAYSVSFTAIAVVLDKYGIYVKL